MKLRLKRPLVFFDLEATGISTVADRIVQISVARYAPDVETDVRTRLINPEMPIPPESIEIHGITDADVADKPTFRQIAKSFFDYLDGCDLAGFNIIQFDIPLLIAEFARSGLAFSMAGRQVIDCYQIFRRMEPRTLEAALRFYCNEEHANAHDSEADVLATIKVLEGQLHKYPDLPKDVDQLNERFNPHQGKYIDWEGKLRWEKGEAVLGFGKKDRHAAAPPRQERSRHPRMDPPRRLRRRRQADRRRRPRWHLPHPATRAGDRARAN